MHNFEKKKLNSGQWAKRNDGEDQRGIAGRSWVKGLSVQIHPNVRAGAEGGDLPTKD